jgi:hypothetical protein
MEHRRLSAAVTNSGAAITNDIAIFLCEPRSFRLRQWLGGGTLMRIEIVNGFDGGWVVADDDLNTALSETSARTPATNPPRRKTPPAKTAAARSAVVPRGLESLARAGIGRAVPTLRPEQHPRRLFRRQQLTPVGGDQTPPWVACARSCGIDTDVWCSPVSNRVVAPPGRDPAFTAAF